MNKIKGLLLKDLLALKVYKRNLITSCIIYALLIVSQAREGDMESLGTIMFILIFSMMSLSTFSYDERSKSDRYILTFPLTRKEIILSKYIMSFGSILLGALVGSITSSLLVFLVTNKIPNIEGVISTIFGGMAGIGFMQAIQIPCIYKWGAEKGRNQIYLIMMVIFALLAGILSILPVDSINLDTIERLQNLLPIISIVITFLVYFISYKISYKIYSKKEV